MNRKKRIHFVLLVWALNLDIALAYETQTHEEVVDHAYRASVLSEDFVWEALRINPNEPLEVFDFEITEFTNDRLDDTEFEGSTPLAIIRTGATLEDEVGDEDGVLRPLNHFFDPFNDRALTIGESILVRDSSPDWSVEEIEISRQRRSYTDAQDLYYEILTEPVSFRRAEFFRNLGQVLHHIADMAQPDHVRNDQHLVTNIDFIDNNSGFTDPSLYELYTSALTEGVDGEDAILFPDSVLQPEFLNTLNGYAPVQLMLPRDYWHTEGAQNYDGVGLAEFTNREFVSNDTIFGTPGSADFPRPNLEEDNSLNGSVSVELTDAVEVYNRFNLTVPELCNSSPTVGLSSCFMRFRAMAVDDNLRPQGNPLVNTYAVTESIFNQDVTEINFEGLIGTAPSGLFTLNTINFWSGYPLLLSRASGYTSGLINHFFRGRLEVGAPEDGIIALADQTDMGFNSIEDDLTGLLSI